MKSIQDCADDLSPSGLTQLQELASGCIGDDFVEFFKDEQRKKVYPDNLKKFFVTLHMKSPRAYRYVREVFKVSIFHSLFLLFTNIKIGNF